MGRLETIQNWIKHPISSGWPGVKLEGNRAINSINEYIDPRRSADVLTALGRPPTRMVARAQKLEELQKMSRADRASYMRSHRQELQQLRDDYRRERGELRDAEFSTEDRIRAAFMNDKGEYSKTRIGVGVAGAYMGANLIGHGSLGIPFISNASWNR